MVKYLILLAICALKYSNADKINCTLAEIEKSLGPVMGTIGMKGENFPENDNQLTEICRAKKRAGRRAQEYSSQCIEGLSSTIMSVMIYSANRNNKRYCGKSNSFLEMGSCANRGKNGTIKCWNQLIDAVFVIKNTNDSKLKIPLVCCNFYEWKSCTVDVYSRIGTQVCTEKAITMLDEMITRGSIDPLNVVCGDYTDDSDKCDKLMETMPELLKRRKGARDHKQPFMYLMEIYGNL